MNDSNDLRISSTFGINLLFDAWPVCELLVHGESVNHEKWFKKLKLVNLVDIILVHVVHIIMVHGSYLQNFINYQSVFSVVIKNCEPFVFGPELAIDKVPSKLNQVLKLWLLL